MHGGVILQHNSTAEPVPRRLVHTLPTVELGGIRLHAATMEEALAAADRAIQERSSLTFGMVNIAKLVNARKDALLRESLLEADMVLADGLPVVWLSRLGGRPLPERVAGIDLMHRLLELADRKGYRVFLLGAREEVNRCVAERIARDYPGCRLAGRRDGYFSAQQEEGVAHLIRDAGADILFVAISPPKKEKFMKRWAGCMRVPVCHGVGGSFDVFAGLTQRAPAWMQRWGLEWLYRIWQEPRRMWRRYLVTNTKALVLLGRVVARRLGKT